MSRDDGFPIADIDSSYLEDAKMRALWQRLRDADRMARAVLLHKATLLASWRHGHRVTVSEAAPTWLPVDEDLVNHLQAVRFLDRTGRIPVASWSVWFGAANSRREARREAGRLAGIASGAARAARARNRARNGRTDGQPDVRDTGTVAEPVVPENERLLNPSVRPSVRPFLPSGPSGQEDAGADPADAYWTLTGKYPTGTTLSWIDDLAGTYGSVAVIRAIATCHQEDSAVRTLLGRAKAALQRDARKLDLAERAAEQARIAEQRKPTVLHQRPDDISDEEADRIAREYRARHAQGVEATV